MREKYLRLLQEIKTEHENRTDTTQDSLPVIVDGMNIFLRAFAANPTSNDIGVHVGGIGGFLKSLGKIIRITGPTRLIVVFDGIGGSLRRKKLFKEYKSGRSSRGRLNRSFSFLSDAEEEEARRLQLMRVGQYMQVLPITTIVIDHIEADDAIAYLASQYFTDEKQRIVIASSDKDYLQLVNDRVNVFSPTKDRMLTPDAVLDEYGIPAHNYLAYRIIQGDASDSIPGVKGIGIKTVQKRFPVFEDRVLGVDDLIEHAEAHADEAKAYRLLLENREVLERNYDLMQLHNVDISAHAKQTIIRNVQAEIPTLETVALKRLFYDDMLWCAIPQLDAFLNRNFHTLNMFAKKSGT